MVRLPRDTGTVFCTCCGKGVCCGKGGDDFPLFPILSKRKEVLVRAWIDGARAYVLFLPRAFLFLFPRKASCNAYPLMGGLRRMGFDAVQVGREGALIPVLHSIRDYTRMEASGWSESKTTARYIDTSREKNPTQEKNAASEKCSALDSELGLWVIAHERLFACVFGLAD